MKTSKLANTHKELLLASEVYEYQLVFRASSKFELEYIYIYIYGHKICREELLSKSPLADGQLYTLNMLEIWNLTACQ